MERQFPRNSGYRQDQPIAAPDISDAPMQSMMTAGQRIALALQARDMSQADLCRAAGCSSSTLSELISGDSKRPRGDTLLRLARALAVHPEWLIHGKGAMDASAQEISDESMEIASRIDALPAKKREFLLDLILGWLREQPREK